MIKLRECPCCGSEAHIDRECIFCDCGICINFEPFYYEQSTDLPIKDRWAIARQEAIEAWNRRADNG